LVREGYRTKKNGTIKVILTYYGYLNEGKGIANWIKLLSSKITGGILNALKKNINSFIVKIELDEIDEIREISIEILKINKNYNSKIICSKNDKGWNKNVRLVFDLPEEIDPYYLHEIVVHELTHLWEFYKIQKNGKKFPLYDRIKKSLIRTIDQDNFDPFIYFRNLVYLTLDNELNARVSQIYQFLVLKKSKDYDSLWRSLKMSKSWKKMVEIESFNPNSFTNNLIEILGEDLTIILINDFNEELIHNEIRFNFIKKVENKIDVLSYFKSWKKRFTYKVSNHRKKLMKIISEVNKEK
jgi:hypothetical protein